MEESDWFSYFQIVGGKMCFIYMIMFSVLNFIQQYINHMYVSQC